MPRASVKKSSSGGPKQKANGAARPAQQRAAPPVNEAYSVGGTHHANSTGGGMGSAYSIMAQRIANRIAEMAESITFAERPKPQETATVEPKDKKKPRKLEMRLDHGSASQGNISFSAPFLDNTLQKMLQLQNRMLKSTAELSKAANVAEKLVKEHAEQSADLSRIIAMICAEKARQE